MIQSYLKTPSPLPWITANGLLHLELVHGLHNTGLLPGPAPADAPVLVEQRSALELCREILSFYGPLTEDAIAAVLPTLPADLLSADETFVQGALVQGSTEEHWCDAENLETLIRFQRAARRQAIEPLSRSQLLGFWSHLHELAKPTSDTMPLLHWNCCAAIPPLWVAGYTIFWLRGDTSKVFWKPHYNVLTYVGRAPLNNILPWAMQRTWRYLARAKVRGCSEVL